MRSSAACHIRLDIAGKYSDHRVVVGFEPVALLRARRRGRRALVRRDKIDDEAERKRDEVADRLPDRGLPLKAAPGKAPVVGQRLPQRPLGIGRIAAKEPRQTADRPALLGNAAGAVLGEQRAQQLGLFAVEHAAARRPFAAFGDRHDDAVQRLNVLPGRLHAGENIAQVDLHGFALVGRPEKFDAFEFALERGKKRHELLLRRRRGFLRHGERQAAAGTLEPFIADNHDGLRQVERGESRIDRQGDDAVGQRHFVVLETIALAAEHDGDGLAGADARRQLHRGVGRADDALGLVVGPRGGRQDEAAVGDRGLKAVKKLDCVEDAVGAGGHHARLVVRPRLPRLDQSELGQSEIGHGAGGRPDVLAKLRLDQDHHRTGRVDPALGLVGAGAWHEVLLGG